MPRAILTILIIFSASSTLLGAGYGDVQWNSAITYHHGFLIAHHPKMQHLQTGKVNAMEIELGKRTDGSKPWHHYFNFPSVGVSFSYWDLSNSTVLGNIVSISPYLDLKLNKGSKVGIYLKAGCGIGLISEKFDADNNYKNIAVSTHVNANAMIHPSIQFRITDNVYLRTGPSLTHFSNGSYQVPNLGLNLMTWKASLRMNLGNQNSGIERKDIPYDKNRWWFIYAGGFKKEIYPIEGEPYYAVTLGGEYMMRITPKSAIGLGADYFYDEALFYKFEEQDIEVNSDLEASRLGLKFCYEMLFNRYSLLFNTGVYVVSKIYNDGYIYSRIGMRYRFSDQFSGILQLKTHFGKADFMELGIGYRIKRNEK
jgi:hypothetical protein